MRRTATIDQLVVLGLALVVLLVAVVAGIAIGARSVAPAEVWRALFDYAGTDDHVVVRDLRLPRTVFGVCVGAALGVSGALIQTLSRNPLSEPGLLGITAGAGFAINVGALAGVAGTQLGQLGLAVVGCAAASVVVYAVGRTSPLRLVLAGVALTAVLMGISLGLRLSFPDVFDQYRFWSVGALAGSERIPMAVPVTVVVLSLAGALLVSRPLSALVLGDDVARGLGASVARTRLIVLVLVTLLAGAATAVAGPIAFAGLIVPHLARRIAADSVPWLIVHSMVVGAVLLVVADIGSRVLLPTGEVPVAVVTAFLGGPVLIWAVRKYEGAGL
ncbi:FecCD family ABC transporter permease [Cryptosporangium aurantiacum]|uniref:Iron complex transport system permease protein n=1 Tax=Cryptosporangium aurantiacum TaxID=134849 RepID=A0A1M7RMR8_9ACTN|nr:iron chelate uptake ABC transporter family permease subunit [Cryptosporangium aurantiacum]SHN47491.1 iron complex transport system permease protein [Cryptosporangium aurantiacum]